MSDLDSLLDAVLASLPLSALSVEAQAEVERLMSAAISRDGHGKP